MSCSVVVWAPVGERDMTLRTISTGVLSRLRLRRAMLHLIFYIFLVIRHPPKWYCDSDKHNDRNQPNKTNGYQ
jgi:hypothetical protein